MVFPDWNIELKTSSSPLVIPTVADRLLAFFIDCLLFFPVVSLILSVELKQLKILALLNANSGIAMSSVFLVLIEVCALLVLWCGSFLRFYGGTPGQRLLHLKVVSAIDGQRLDFLQASLRTVWWIFGAVTLLPLMSIYTNFQRRAFHDRATDSILLSEQKAGSDQPSYMERRFFQSWSQFIFAIFILVAVTAFFDLRRRLHQSSVLVEVAKSDPLDCGVVSEEKDPYRQLDMAMVLYHVGGLSEKCLHHWADQAVWTNDRKMKSLGYLAKSEMLIGDVAKDYRQKACDEAQETAACAIAKYKNAKQPQEESLSRYAQDSMLSRVYQVEGFLSEKKYLPAASALGFLEKEDFFEAYVDHYSMKIVWGMNQAHATRTPASGSEWRQVYSDLKHKLDLP